MKCLEQRIVVSVTYTQDISVAFQMFVSVNKGGTPLNDYDLFRGLIMTKAHTLGLDQQLKPDVRQMSAQILTCMGKQTGTKSEALHNDLMRKWVSARYGLSITSRDVASRLDKEIRSLTELGELKEIVTQAYSFFKAYAQISDGAEMGRIASAGAGWLPGVLQSRRIQGLAGGDFIKLQHSVVLIAMWARQHQGQKPYSDQDINDVMDYIEWLEFRLAGDGDSSRTLYSVYSKMASRAFGASKQAHGGTISQHATTCTTKVRLRDLLFERRAGEQTPRRCIPQQSQDVSEDPREEDIGVMAAMPYNCFQTHRLTLGN